MEAHDLTLNRSRVRHQLTQRRSQFKKAISAQLSMLIDAVKVTLSLSSSDTEVGEIQGPHRRALSTVGGQPKAYKQSNH